MVPLEMAVRAEQSGVNRAAMDPLTVFVLSLMGGAFVAFGAIFATTVSAGAGPSDYGVTRLLVGVVSRPASLWSSSAVPSSSPATTWSSWHGRAAK
jgi:formate/nitrite transporter FocA (FNT family)